MKKICSNNGAVSERGLTLIEQVITLLVIGLAVIAWMQSFGLATKGSVRSKSSMKAQNLALSKMEEVKSLALNISMAGAWQSLTNNAMTRAYALTQTTQLDGRAYTWRVSSNYAKVTLTGAPLAVTSTSDTVLMQAEVSWIESNTPFSITLTSYVSDLRQ